MATDYDVIVVGARCAGSPTAMLLARHGHRVLLLDRAEFPCDTLSTHVIHAPGVAALDRWGLLDRVVASGCPPIETYSFNFGPITISGSPQAFEGKTVGYAPRRTILDQILIDGARESGVEVREHVNVDELIVEEGVVVGVRCHVHDGESVEERARVVIGADGRNSHIAKAVGAEQYNEKPQLERGYYTYWSGLPVTGFEIFIRPDRGWAAVGTNDGLTMLVVGWPHAESASYKADVEANYLKTLELAPEFAARVSAATRVEPFSGGSVLNFFRTPFGPGWALVGDAGYTKDPITAQGISDAFRDAELCSTALDEFLGGARSYDEAMGDYQRKRDEEAFPIYEFTTQLATLEPPPPEMLQLLGAVHGNQEAMDAFVSVNAGTLSPTAFFDPANVGRIMGAAAAPA